MSDQILYLLIHNPETMTNIQMVKGWCFVLVSAIIIFLLLNRELGKYQRSEMALRESESQFRGILENSLVAIALLDTEGHPYYSNSALSRMVGYSTSEIAAMVFTDFTHPDDVQKDMDHFRELVAGSRDSYEINKRYIHKNGKVIHAEVKVSPIRDDKGDLKWIIGMANDTTDRKHAEEARKSLKRNYEEIFNATNEAIIIHDGETGEILEVNRTVSDMFGYSSQEALGLSVGDLGSDEPDFSQREALKRIRKAKEEGPQVFDWRSKKKNGERFWSSVSLTSTRIGGRGRVLAVIRDISDRKRSEEAWRENEFRLNTLLNHQFQLTGLLNPDGVVLMINQTACKIVGRKVADLVGKYFWELPHWSHSEELMERVRESVKKVRRGQRVSFEVTHLDTEGESRHIDFSMRPIADEKGRVTFLIPEGQDITEAKKTENKRKVLEQQLQQAHKMEAIGTLAGGIAHDFNNILGAIIGFTELAALDLPEEGRAKSNLEQVKKASLRAVELVKQILTFSRREEQEFIPVKLDTVAREATKLLRASIPTTIEIKVQIEADTGSVLADPTQIHQVLMNLSTNAAHAMEENGGLLTLALKNTGIDSAEAYAIDPKLEPGAYVQLTVSDTGHGIPPDRIDRIFEPFYTTKEQGEGTGMGLAVVHGIINSCGGAITVESEPGQGSTFNIYLPQAGLETPSEVTVAPELELGNGRVLVVDDEEQYVGMLKQMITRLGYEVEATTSGPEALSIFRARPDDFVAVVTDQTMPKKTGLELATEILELRADMPIVLCTGYSKTVDSETARRKGIREFIMKPLVFHQLGQALNRAIDGPAHE